MTIERKAELFDEMLDWVFDHWGDDPVEPTSALVARGFTKEETIAQVTECGFDGEAAREAYEEEY